jgi:mannosyltransferase
LRAVSLSATLGRVSAETGTRLSRRSPLEALAALTVGAALIRFSTLGTQSYWYDEAVTVGLVRHSLHGMLGALPHSESTPPAYYVLAWAWSRLFGTGEAGLRSLSAVFGTATVPATYAAARSFVPRRSSLIAAALIAVSPLLVWYSQEARAYALLVLLGALSLACLRRAAERPSGRWSVAWAILSSLALATHYFAFFLVAAEAVWLLRRSPDRRATNKAVALVAGVAAALTPLAAYQARYSTHTAWISNSGVGGRAAYLLHQLVVGAYPASHIRPVIAAVPVVVLVGLFVWTKGSERAGALLALAFGLVAIGAPLVLAFVGDQLFGGRGDYFIYRNVIVAVVPLTIAAAAVAGAARAGRVAIGAVAVACLVLVAVSIDIARRPALQRPDVRAVAAALGPPHVVRAIVIDARSATVLELYLRDVKASPEQGAYVREIDLIPEPKSSIARSLPSGFRRVQTRHVDTFTIVRLEASRPLLTKPANLVHELPRSSPEVAILLERPRH